MPTSKKNSKKPHKTVTSPASKSGKTRGAPSSSRKAEEGRGRGASVRSATSTVKKSEGSSQGSKKTSSAVQFRQTGKSTEKHSAEASHSLKTQSGTVKGTGGDRLPLRNKNAEISSGKPQAHKVVEVKSKEQVKAAGSLLDSKKDSKKAASSISGLKAPSGKSQVTKISTKLLEQRLGRGGGADKRHCREPGCELSAMVQKYCRLHYIKNWKRIKRKEAILRERKLDVYIEELVAKYPDKYLDAIRADLASEQDFLKIISELEIEDESSSSTGTSEDFEQEPEVEVEEIIDTAKRAELDEDDEFGF